MGPITGLKEGLVILLVLAGFAGWAVIELLRWLFTHIDLSWVS